MQLPVPFQTIYTHISTFSESDWETAIDMSHTSGFDEETELELSAGTRIFFKAYESETHFSYLEPDFDELEKSGEVVYETHASEEDSLRSSSTVIGIKLPALHPYLTQKEVEELASTGYQTALQDYLDFPYAELTNSEVEAEGLTSELRAELAAVLQNLQTEVGNKGAFYVSEACALALRQLEARAQTRRLTNLYARIELSAQQALLACTRGQQQSQTHVEPAEVIHF